MFKILYLSHIDWGWIKQRPQFIAEHLSAQGLECEVYYQRSRRRVSLKDLPTTGYKATPLWKVPLKNKSRVLTYLNKVIQRAILKSLIRSKKPDVVWVTHPEFLDGLPKPLAPKLAYDCMDDVIAFYDKGGWIAEHFLASEGELLRRADYVFFSSEHLKRTVLSRATTNASALLVRNAYGKDRASSQAPESYSKGSAPDRPPTRIAYFGTISTWLDFPALANCCDVHSSLEIDLFGPLEPPNMLLANLSSQIKYKGVLPHSELKRTSKLYDVLIMPFMITDLIKSVDPVKLYEYIDFDRPIISVYYDEIRRFEKFVNFYRTREELAALVGQTCKTLKKYSEKERMEFLNKNTWAERAELVKQVLLRCE